MLEKPVISWNARLPNEIANVNFLYDIVHALQNTIDSHA